MIVENYEGVSAPVVPAVRGVDPWVAAMDDAILAFVYRNFDSLDCMLHVEDDPISVRHLCEAALDWVIPLPITMAKEFDSCEDFGPVRTYRRAARILLNADWT